MLLVDPTSSSGDDVVSSPALCVVRRDGCHSDVRGMWYFMFKICISPVTSEVLNVFVCLPLFNFLVKLLFPSYVPTPIFILDDLPFFCCRHSSGIDINSLFESQTSFSLWLVILVTFGLTSVIPDFFILTKRFINLLLHSFGFWYHI